MTRVADIPANSEIQVEHVTRWRYLGPILSLDGDFWHTQDILTVSVSDPNNANRTIKTSYLVNPEMNRELTLPWRTDTNAD
jgi:hypothetical protein